MTSKGSYGSKEIAVLADRDVKKGKGMIWIGGNRGGVFVSERLFPVDFELRRAGLFKWELWLSYDVITDESDCDGYACSVQEGAVILADGSRSEMERVMLGLVDKVRGGGEECRAKRPLLDTSLEDED